ncbi:DotI/IcmL family type IV secretion protein [Legionella norrlandica]|uniref:DotI/IcmL family type IV secretion protein n=1 Tax=Legionella norrlandica TaxID=1498499 RepID=UPI000ADFC8DB|nr:DotI/IcmL family type IV secretion protein [Legionella norrlandica]
MQNALRKSNNIETIKAENLIVKGERDGESQIIEARDNRWKIIMPFKVSYQNDEKKVIHFLNVYLVIGWKNTDSLGIVQMIATPRLAPLSQKITPVNEAIKSVAVIFAERKAAGFDSAKEITKSFLEPLFSKDEITRKRLIRHAVFNKSRQKIDAIPPISNETLSEPGHMMAQRLSFPIPESQRITGIALVEQSRMTHAIACAQIIPNDFKTNYKTFDISWLKQMGKFYSELTRDYFISQMKWSLREILAKYQSVMQKSVPRNAISNQNPIVSAQIEGEPKLIELKENQWDIKIPIKVVYQKDKERITQRLDINVTLNQQMIDDLLNKPRNAVSSHKMLPYLKSALAPSTHIKSLVYRVKSRIDLNKQKQKDNISCDYKISPETIIDKDILLRWAEQATIQSFAFDHRVVEAQLQKLESCYTENGWIEFNAAMHKSGNIIAIKTQRLTMNSQIDGQPRLVEDLINQWKITLPLKVTYKNDRTQALQFLDVQLIVGRKTNGGLGIVQMNAVLKTSPSS